MKLTDYQVLALREMAHQQDHLKIGGLREAPRTCRVLVRHGLSEERTPGVFFITDAGREFLRAHTAKR